MNWFIPVAIVGGVALLSSIRILFEYQRGVVFRFGKLIRAKGPGPIFLVPFGIERMERMDLRIMAHDATSAAYASNWSAGAGMSWASARRNCNHFRMMKDSLV